MIACGSGYARLDFGVAVGDRPARQYRDPTIDIAPGRHAGGPVATFDDARIEIDRMGHGLEVSITAGTLVPFGLELFQRLQQMVSRRDRVRARAGLEHVHGMPRTFRRNQITPTCERTILPEVGSGMKQASARYPRCSVESAPTPVLSSSITDWKW